MLPADLPAELERIAAQAEEYTVDPGAVKAYRKAAEMARQAWSAYQDTPMTPAQAEAEGVCSGEAVRKAVREGRAENVGTDTRIQVRRKDLPKGRSGKPGNAASFARAMLAVTDTAMRRGSR